MASVEAQHMIDYEQNRGKHRRFNSRGYTTGLALVERKVIPIVEKLGDVIINEETEKITDEPVVLPSENFRATYLVPHLSRKGKFRLDEVTGSQGLRLEIRYIKGEYVKKYLAEGEVFPIPKNNKVVKIIIEGIPTEYSGLPILVQSDKILGFPDWQSEKPHSSSKK